MNSTVRTPEQTHVAIFWQSTPVAAWNAVARNLLADPRYAADTADSARLFAMLNLTGADSSINCWNDRYYWDFWRPWNAIPRAGEDGNPATIPDPNWTGARLGHPAASALPRPPVRTSLPRRRLPPRHEDVLRHGKIRFGVTSVRFPGETRYYDRFSRALSEIIDARIWLGLHYRTADVQAQLLGKKVARYMIKHYFQLNRRAKGD